METSVKLYTLTYHNVKTYRMAGLFILGNILLPQLCHLMPQGGMIWLPIYFFTLIAAYKYGWKAGLLTAILSPVINSALFGMPAPTVLPAILLKSVALALTAGYIAHRFQKVNILLLLATVLAYQIIGTAGGWLMTGSFYAAIQDFRIGVPGMLVQIAGGYGVIRYLLTK